MRDFSIEETPTVSGLVTTDGMIATVRSGRFKSQMPVGNYS